MHCAAGSLVRPGANRIRPLDLETDPPLAPGVTDDAVPVRGGVARLTRPDGHLDDAPLSGLQHATVDGCHGQVRSGGVDVTAVDEPAGCGAGDVVIKHLADVRGRVVHVT